MLQPAQSLSLMACWTNDDGGMLTTSTTKVIWLSWMTSSSHGCVLVWYLVFVCLLLPSDGDTKWGIKSTRHSWCETPVMPCEALKPPALLPFTLFFSTVCPMPLCSLPWTPAGQTPDVSLCCQTLAIKPLLSSPAALLPSPDVKPCCQPATRPWCRACL
jgi:hypothetical protein